MLVEALCRYATLTTLTFHVIKLLSKVRKILYGNTTLTCLNLYGNKLNFEGGKALAKVLCKNNTLTALNLGNNNLGSEGEKALAEALHKNIILTSFISS
ncbi:hypothetical protein F8M41_020857 [Gigaspora margarita]|uniref:Uncharacterized protein n=1 Tax=Gigaspora margarita TaxID=4874 RepID=A0A8H4EJE9_GIGMA|nr:hypothetical protein F8M41_020857 [Gigaspora margarita]